MNAGDKHTVNPRSSRVMGSNKHHRDMDHISIAELLHGTKRRTTLTIKHKSQTRASYYFCISLDYQQQTCVVII